MVEELKKLEENCFRVCRILKRLNPAFSTYDVFSFDFSKKEVKCTDSGSPAYCFSTFSFDFLDLTDKDLEDIVDAEFAKKEKNRLNLLISERESELEKIRQQESTLKEELAQLKKKLAE